MGLEIIDLSNHKKKDTTYIKNFLAPIVEKGQSFRFLEAGASGKGKTNVAIDLILHHLKWDKLFLYSRHLYDVGDLYMNCIALVEKAQERIRKKLKDPNYTIIQYSDKFEDIPTVTVENFDPRFVNVVVIDDFMNNQDLKIDEYFTSGRHLNVNVFYMTQSMYTVSKTIRLNCNYFAFFKFASAMEMRLLASDFCAEKTYDQLVCMMKEALNSDYSFFLIDMKTNDKNLKYRKNFDQLLICDDEDNEESEENN